MRLIDADKVIQSVDRQITISRMLLGNDPQAQEFVSITEQSIKQEISNAPTVKAIPLDKPFCKMVYGDYVCYNRNWLMKHLPMELDILQGKAIPVEWIKKYIKQNYCTCDLVYPEEFLKELVTWWGEENESNVSN